MKNVFWMSLVWFCVLWAIPQSGFADDTIDAMRETAHSLHVKGDYQGALELYRKLYSQDESIIYLFNIGTCEYQLKHFGLAIDAWEQYVQAAAAEDNLEQEDLNNIQVAKKYIGKLKEKVGYLHIIGRDNDEVYIHGAYRTKLPFDDNIRVSDKTAAGSAVASSQTDAPSTLVPKKPPPVG